MGTMSVITVLQKVVSFAGIQISVHPLVLPRRFQKCATENGRVPVIAPHLLWSVTLPLMFVLISKTAGVVMVSITKNVLWVVTALTVIHFTSMITPVMTVLQMVVSFAGTQTCVSLLKMLRPYQRHALMNGKEPVTLPRLLWFVILPMTFVPISKMEVVPLAMTQNVL